MTRREGLPVMTGRGDLDPAPAPTYSCRTTNGSGRGPRTRHRTAGHSLDVAVRQDSVATRRTLLTPSDPSLRRDDYFVRAAAPLATRTEATMVTIDRRAM